MKSQRQLQIGENIKRLMSEILMREDFLFVNNNVITILEADVSPDAKNVKIYVDIFGDNSKKQITFDKLSSRTLHFRFELAKKIKLRVMPEINFVLDKTNDNASIIENIVAHETKSYQDTTSLPIKTQKTSKKPRKKT